MNDNATLAHQMVVAALVATRNVNLSTDPKRMAVIKVWNAMFGGARKYGEAEGFIGIHNMPPPHIVSVTGACENTGSRFTVDWYDGRKMFLPQSNQLYIEMLTQSIFR